MGKFHTKRYYKKQIEYYEALLNWYKISYSMLKHTLNSVYGTNLCDTARELKKCEEDNKRLRSHILKLMESRHEREVEIDTKQARICILEQQLEDEKAKNKEAKAKVNAYDEWFKHNDCELVFSDDYSKAEVKYYL